MLVWIYGLIGLVIFFYYLMKGQGASQEINMELGLALAFLAATIGWGMSFQFQIAAIVMVVILLLQKGFVKDTEKPSVKGM